MPMAKNYFVYPLHYHTERCHPWDKSHFVSYQTIRALWGNRSLMVPHFVCQAAGCFSKTAIRHIDQFESVKVYGDKSEQQYRADKKLSIYGPVG